jgi:hypothetical protein
MTTLTRAGTGVFLAISADAAGRLPFFPKRPNCNGLFCDRQQDLGRRSKVLQRPRIGNDARFCLEIWKKPIVEVRMKLFSRSVVVCAALALALTGIQASHTGARLGARIRRVPTGTAITGLRRQCRTARRTLPTLGCRITGTLLFRPRSK